VHDIRAAVQFMRGSAREFGLDPNRVALWGNSAGAHLAMLGALAGDGPPFKGGYPPGPQASLSPSVEGASGTYGTPQCFARRRHWEIGNAGDTLVESMLGVSPVKDRRIYFDASPISHAITANNKTAVFLIWGTEDDVVDYKTQSLEFLLALKQAEFQVRPCV